MTQRPASELLPAVDAFGDDLPEADRRFHDRLDALALRLRALMEAQDLSQQDLADRLGKDKGYVSRVLAGSVNLTLRTLCEFEGALSADLIHIEKPPRPAGVRRQVSDAPAPASDLYAEMMHRLQSFAQQMDQERTSDVGGGFWLVPPSVGPAPGLRFVEIHGRAANDFAAVCPAGARPVTYKTEQKGDCFIEDLFPVA